MYITDSHPKLAHNPSANPLSLRERSNWPRQRDHDPRPVGCASRHQKRRLSVAKASRKKQPFNVKVFLSTVNGGRTITKYRKGQKIFRQGDPANAVLYIQGGAVKV